MAAGGQARFGARRLAEGKSGQEVALLILGRFFSVVASRVKHVLDSYLDFFFFKECFIFFAQRLIVLLFTHTHTIWVAK